MKKNLYNWLRLLRPRQWIKNFAIFAAVVFNGQLFEPFMVKRVVLGFIIFCLLASSVYILNDILDVESDRKHPFKRFRPLAKGDLSLMHAFALAAILAFVALVGSLMINTAFFLISLVYLILQTSYSLFLKRIAIIDILAVAAGYILRVLAGEVVSGLHISAWLFLTTISLSLFLAIGKRRMELTLNAKHALFKINSTRQSLSHYSERLLDVYASVFVTSTFISYSLFTFLENQRSFSSANDLLLPDFLPPYLQRKWLMITILPVVYGLMRYLQDIYEKEEGESPEKVLLSDKPLLATVIIWVLLVIGIIYLRQGVILF